jgi:uncharacterized protein (DUF1330 family)
VSAYLISDVRAKDPEAFEAYRTRAAASLVRYGGRYLARGGAMQIVEGCWAPQALVIVQFDTEAQAAAWYESAEYAEALALREQAQGRDLILVDGLDPESD